MAKCSFRVVAFSILLTVSEELFAYKEVLLVEAFLLKVGAARLLHPAGL